MLNAIMNHIHNDFHTDVQKVGTFVIADGAIDLSDIKDGQYFKIEGSVFNNGVFKYPVTNLIDEEFTGTITYLAIPQDFIDLVDEIDSYVNSNSRDGLQSESFAGYSYTRATTSNGTMADWHDIFRQRLNQWRKI